jgi:flagellar biogenesis protein FliO
MGRNSQVIRVISRSVVGPKQQFLLVQIGRRLVLVGDSGANMSSLAEIDDADEVASLVGELQSESSTSSVSAFGSLFRKAGNEFEHSDVQQDEPVQREDEAPARELVAAAGEITGLMDRVRMLSKRIRQT